MIRINNINVPLDYDFTNLKRLCVKRLGLKYDEIKSVKLAKKSVDARKKNDVHFTISIDAVISNEGKILKNNKNAVKIEKYEYNIPKAKNISKRPVVVGFGPAGMFASLVLAESGAKPIIIERGGDVDSRKKAVEHFWNSGELSTECNVQFGEGGAGTFSDGKLTTGTKDKRIKYLFNEFVRFGAPEEILYMAKPHIGTDKLCDTVKNLRKYIIEKGAEIHFNSRFCGYDTEDDAIKGVKYIEDGIEKYIETSSLILATGHSARDVFEMLNENNVKLSQKNFAVGVRIEHLREDIDKEMYGKFAGHKELKAADYKLVSHLKDGRSVYTFCMCPGGYVVAAASENNQLATNGMSLFARDNENSNSALLTGITPEDLDSNDPLAGMYFQRELEKKAFIAGGSNYNAPVCRCGDFIAGTKTTKFGRVKPTYKTSTKFAMPEEYLPEFICKALKEGIIDMSRRMKSLADPDAIITGIESRSSSPVRIDRDENLESLSVKGLYPCGEGAGYAGGIVSAGVDGIKCAEEVLKNIVD